MSHVAIRKVISHINETVAKYDNVYVMVSGGVDSMFLLNFMLKRNLKFEVIHFQHGIRSNDNVEVDLIQKVCSQYGIKLHIGHGDNIPETNTEALAHFQRWGFVKSILSGTSNLVITGHNQDDNIEHVFLSHIRGKPHDNLNMRTFTQYPEMMKYKPLLSFPKKVIYTLAKAQELEWVEDSTNADTKYTRNLVRELLMPIRDRFNLNRAMAKSFVGVEC